MSAAIGRDAAPPAGAPLPEAGQAGWLLAIDSSTEQAGLALYDGQRLAELNWTAGRDQTVALLDQLDQLLTLCRLSTDRLAAIAIATGPGMFSGLRVGMSVAKGLVLATDLPLIGVSTLDATAAPFAGLGRPIVAVVAAGRGRLVWALTGGPPGVDPSPRNGTIAELSDAVAELPGVIVAGELTAEQAETLATLPGVVVPPLPARQRRAALTAELAWRRWRAGDTDDPVRLEPVYLHAARRT